MTAARAKLLDPATGRAADIPAAELAPGCLPVGAGVFAPDLAACRAVLDALPVVLTGPLTPPAAGLIAAARALARPLLDKPAGWWEEFARRSPPADGAAALARVIAGAVVVGPAVGRRWPGDGPADAARRAAYGLVVLAWAAGATPDQARAVAPPGVPGPAVDAAYAALDAPAVAAEVAALTAVARDALDTLAAPPGPPAPRGGWLARARRFLRRATARG